MRKTEQQNLSVQKSPVRVFFSYASEDRELRDELIKHLAIMQREGLIQAWHDEMVRPGDPWRPALEHAIDTAELILLLVSADYQASDECFVQQMVRALERQNQGKALVVPILLRPCCWESAPFASLKPLPSNQKPITSWENRDEAFANITSGIRKILGISVQHPTQAAEFPKKEGTTSQERRKPSSGAGLGYVVLVGVTAIFVLFFVESTRYPRRLSSSMETMKPKKLDNLRIDDLWVSSSTIDVRIRNEGANTINVTRARIVYPRCKPAPPSRNYTPPSASYTIPSPTLVRMTPQDPSYRQDQEFPISHVLEPGDVDRFTITVGSQWGSITNPEHSGVYPQRCPSGCVDGRLVLYYNGAQTVESWLSGGSHVSSSPSPCSRN